MGKKTKIYTKNDKVEGFAVRPSQSSEVSHDFVFIIDEEAAWEAAKIVLQENLEVLLREPTDHFYLDCRIDRRWVDLDSLGGDLSHYEFVDEEGNTLTSEIA